MTLHQTPIGKAIDKIGNATALALALKVSVQAVGQWKNNIRPIPPERCVEIERLTDGEVTAESLSPESRWVRTGDPAWPNARGRPLLDVAARPDLALVDRRTENLPYTGPDRRAAATPQEAA